MLSRYVVSQVKHNGYFLVGLAMGLWLALAAVPLEDEPVCAAPPSPVADDYEPQREERPDHLAVPAGRAVQRPRYYSTELGMRAPLLAGVLAAGQGAPGARAAAINTTARALPALKLFITADARQATSGLANVVGFTDTREMLRPFHALKYLADNFLEEYDFFFLASDTAYINARRLQRLVSRLSVSQDVYMGTPAEGDSHYCSLESGIIMSNSVLRAVHGALDWCVRNSYSPHHHENLGRCVLHAAHRQCTPAAQGETYTSVQLSDPPQLTPALADAVTAHPARSPADMFAAHAYVARVRLQRKGREARALRAAVRRGVRRHPPGFRNGTWPGGLRGDPGLAPPAPESRFDHVRWTRANLTHALMPDELRAAAPLSAAHARAMHLVWELARAWSLRRWGARSAALVEGALRWEPATALRYRLLVRLSGDASDEEGSVRLRQVEVVRTLGAARLAPVPYVTESARLSLLLPVLLTPAALRQAKAFLARYEAVALLKDKNTNLVIVLISDGPEPEEASSLRAAAAALGSKHRAIVDVTSATLASSGTRCTERQQRARAERAAFGAARARLPRGALVLLADAGMEFNEDFLNRARMNSIAGVQWFLPSAFARYATYAHPRVVGPGGARPQHHTGRFSARRGVVAVYAEDYHQAEAEWTASGGAAEASVAEVLAASSVRGLRAPEPGLVLQPERPPCDADAARESCLARLRDAGEFDRLELGAKHALAKLLLEVQADAEP